MASAAAAAAAALPTVADTQQVQPLPASAAAATPSLSASTHRPTPADPAAPPIDYYAADRASRAEHRNKPPPPEENTIPLDYYVADRSPRPPQQPPHAPYPYQTYHAHAMAAGPAPYGGGPPPYQGQPGQWQQPPPQGTPIACLGPHPAPVVCPNCRHSGVTAVEYSSGGFTHALGALLCFVTCLGCIPYFFSGLKDATHKCANCGVPLATYHRSGRTEPHIQG